MGNIIKIDTCPRRIHEIGPWEYKENLDGWSEDNSILHCIFCGSIDPVYLLDIMANNSCTLGPTDKNYKVYVEKVDGSYIGKFYFQHFNEEQKVKFIKLYNTRPRTFIIGYPHHFYVLPYFTRLADE